ncbi:hypothetical protein [Agrococcus lahaulensis]|uniref:hypothetical protein n=1 Tax=Agrococcus lahaulensis TaxID=341722 RepID=UPI00047945D5|nr:hypothetical protein [Agrococcus lahaulensis]
MPDTTQPGDGVEAVDPAASDASLGAAEWPAGEADEPHGRAQVADSMHGTAAEDAAEEQGAGGERGGMERESDDGELTPSDS